MKNSIYYILLSTTLTCAYSPKISIITSLYKGDDFIEGFLQDITKQTVFNQCELIIINANSPGNEEPVIRCYMQRYPNILYTRFKSDPGLYGVWNRAIKMARGEYITNANVDDRLAHNCYEVHALVLDSNPQVELVYSDYYTTTLANKDFNYMLQHSKPINYKALNPQRAYHIPVGNYIWISHKPLFSKERLKHGCLPNNHPMWRKSLHNRYGFFDENLKIVGDLEMWLRAATQGALFKKVPAILGVYYYNPRGLSTSPHNGWLQERARVLHYYKEL